MAEERKDSFAETVDTAASAAHTVKGAIKAGKAISGAAKGAAAGGPYGAVAGAVWAGRKHIGKIITVIIILLLLPVLFVLMLPGLIFGGLINAFSPADTEQPVLNSETAIVENANDITFTINSILGEALDDVMARIEADFASSGADQMEIKNPYSSGPVYNANLIISQYCAARDEDFESISLDDLAAVLRENKENLYSYTSARESREVTSEDPETGEETTTTEIWMVYTIRYNGESYLADHVFALTDEQKELASDYASNLSMFLGDGLLQNLTEWTGNSIPSLGDVTFTDGVTPVVYFNQLDERYASQPYGTDNIGGYGCGPTAMSIVVSSLTDETVDPVAMAQWSYENGYWCKNSGSYHALIPAAAEAWGLPVLDISSLTGDLLTVGMFVVLDFVWDRAKADRTEEKAIFIDECWQLLSGAGATGTRLAGDFVLEIFKTIRGYGGSAVCASQDLNDFFNLDEGRFGKGIINNSKTKIILNLEDDEAERVQETLHLSDAETMEVTHFERGNGLISTNNNNIMVEFKASPLEKDLITTDRRELREILERKRREQESA